MATLGSIVVYSTVLFQRTGQVRQWADRVEREFTANAIAAAPMNRRINKGRSPYPVGALKASIRGGVDQVGPHQLNTTISVNVPYATYVLFGTGPIRPGKLMALPNNPPYSGPRRFVRGQASNNFLFVAAFQTGRSHSSLRGFGGPFRGF